MDNVGATSPVQPFGLVQVVHIILFAHKPFFHVIIHLVIQRGLRTNRTSGIFGIGLKEAWKIKVSQYIADIK